MMGSHDRTRSSRAAAQTGPGGCRAPACGGRDRLRHLRRPQPYRAPDPGARAGHRDLAVLRAAGALRRPDARGTRGDAAAVRRPLRVHTRGLRPLLGISVRVDEPAGRDSRADRGSHGRVPDVPPVLHPAVAVAGESAGHCPDPPACRDQLPRGPVGRAGAEPVRVPEAGRARGAGSCSRS